MSEKSTTPKDKGIARFFNHIRESKSKPRKKIHVLETNEIKDKSFEMKTDSKYWIRKKIQDPDLE